MCQNRIPSYRKQRCKGRPDRAFIEVHGRRHYLGIYGSRESQEAYRRYIAEQYANGEQLPSDVTLTELCAQYWKVLESTNQRPANHRSSLRILRELYGQTAAVDFGPRALKTVREAMVAKGWSRKYVNRSTQLIRRLFKWAVSEEMIPVTVFHSLQSVEGLRRGLTSAPETEPVRPVLIEHVNAIRQFVSHQVWAMIQLQLRSGARPGEVVSIRLIDIDMTNDVWLYRPVEHKTAHHGIDRVIPLGKECKRLITPFMSDRSLDSYLFSPRDAEQERRATLHALRKTPLSCGNSPGTNRKRSPSRKPRASYTPVTYARAIARAVKLAFRPPDLDDNAFEIWRAPQHWYPNQLRHNYATEVRQQFGLEAAQVVLGHQRADVTQIYAERDLSKAIDIARRIG